MSSHRINHQLSFVLSSEPYRENSLLVEIFSRDHGRVLLMARGARARGSALRGSLTPFVPISLSWFGKNDLKTLHRAEWVGGWALPQGRALFTGWYINELILKLMTYYDAYPSLFDELTQLFKALSQGNVSGMLRIFEYNLLKQLGFAPDFLHDEHGNAIEDNRTYYLQADHAISSSNRGGLAVQGAVLLQLARGQLRPENIAHALPIMRLLIDFRVDNGMVSRQILQQLSSLSKE